MVLRLRSGHADRVADLDVRQAPELSDLARGDRRARSGPAAAEDADRGDLLLLALAEAQPVPGAHPAREHADIGDPLAGRAAFDLEHGAGGRTVGIALGHRQQFADAGRQRGYSRARDRGAEEHRMHQRSAGLCGQGRAELAVPGRRPRAEIRGQNLVVLAGQEFGQRGRESNVGRAAGPEIGGPDAKVAHRSHRDARGRQFLRNALQDRLISRAAAVDLVHEDQHRDVQPPQRPHQHAGLRLHALHRGDHQHGAVEHAQHPFHLGDEIRVAGGVDQVDRDLVDAERHDRGLDRDTAPSLQREGVGLGTAVIDAAHLVDDAGGVQQPLGQARLTGVYMGQNPQVQRSH